MPSLVCICQICKCGQHRCPHKPHGNIIKKSDQSAFLTEYETVFHKHQNTSRRSIIRPPERSVDKDNKMVGETTTMRNFVAHPVTPQTKKMPAKYKAPQGMMDTTSEYKQEYQGKWGQPSQLIPPPVTERDHGEAFDPTTTHSREFTTKPIPPLKLYKSGYAYEPPKDTFNTSSTAHADFTDYGQVPVTPSLKPPMKPATSDEPFNEVSAYRTTFTPLPMPERIIKPKEIYVPSKNGLSSSTTNRMDYCMRPLADRRKCIRPQENKFNDDNIPFENSTTNRRCYKSWDLPSKMSRPPTLYSPPTVKLSDETTFKSDYPRYEYTPPSSSFKPAHQSDQVGPFDGRTTKATDYKVWSDVSRPPAIIHDKKYEPPKDKFEGITTFQAHYLGTAEPRVPSTKPPEKGISSSEKIESRTSYREDYCGSGYKVCPAALLSHQGNEKEFAYSHEDTVSGHKFYKPNS